MLASEELFERLSAGGQLVAESFCLDLADCPLRVRSNSQALIDSLKKYFSHVLAENVPGAREMHFLDGPVPDLPEPFQDWPREVGKAGRKDAFAALADGRLIRKVKTGMLFLQSASHLIAAGPCLANENQLINYINAQFMNALQQQSWLLCHAAALSGKTGVLAIAGLSGGGKSSLMLRLLEQDALHYLTNDRLLVQAVSDRVLAQGIPKMPRINPGTITANPRLHPLVSAQELERWRALPVSTLWDLEQKHDVMVNEVYGAGRIATQGELKTLLVLNWRRDSTAPVRLQLADLSQRQDLLGAIMKSPGPFYVSAEGEFLQPGHSLDRTAYLQTLAEVRVFEAVGGVDFEALAALIAEEMGW